MSTVTKIRAMSAPAVVAVIAMLLALGFARSASAHSDTFSSVPAASSTSANVSQIQFTFAEPVQKNLSPEVVLRSSGGVIVPTGAPTFDVTGATMTVSISGGALPDGSYTAVYRVVSKDSHVASGALNFTVAGSTAQAQPRDAGSSAPVSRPRSELSPSNDVPWLPLLASIGGAVLLLSAVTVVVIRRRRGKF